MTTPGSLTRLVLLALVALSFVACDPTTPSAAPTPNQSASAASAAPGSTATTAPAPTTVPSPSPSLAPGAAVTDENGVRLEITPAATTINAGKGLDFTVALTNLRATPLQYEGRDCFAFFYVEAETPREPGGRTDWTGREAAFKTLVLGGGPPQKVYYEPAATVVEVLSKDCPADSGMTSPLAPGATISATFHWAGSFEAALPVPPGSATFRALVRYANTDTLVTQPPPPGPTGCPCSRFEPTLEDLNASGTTAIVGKTRQMASLGQVLDSALANQQLRTFLSKHELGVDDCIVNLDLPDDAGPFLPPGPGWVLEVLCLNPRRYVYLKIDPWTAAIKGERDCKVSCWR
ncbi:MAG TPA: hypothetical protein VGM94_08575 [Galbitalea sp.]|jgi:hypothetical protein